MDAALGDQIVIETSRIDSPKRCGEVIEVIGQGSARHYRVRWDNGHESVFFPGADARVVSEK